MIIILTLDSLSSVATVTTSLYLVTNQAKLPSKSLTLEIGSLARSRENSAGGSKPEARRNGKLGAFVAIEAIVLIYFCD